MPIPQAIQREHIKKALDAIRKGGDLPLHRQSTGYDILYRGKRYPPKYVVALAHSFVSPESGQLRGFRGGVRTNRFLRSRGFEIVEKRDPSAAPTRRVDRSAKTGDKSHLNPATTPRVDDRRFWVVSPNVMNSNKTVGAWKQASVSLRAAFMGYGPTDRKHKDIGYKFAHTVSRGDLILIARRYRNEPEIVGFGVVRGKFQKTMRGFTAPEKANWRGSLRKLSPFIAADVVPSNIPILRVLFHTIALRQLHPQADGDHKTICEWMLNELGANGGDRRPPPRLPAGPTSLVPLSSVDKLEFEVRTRDMVRSARKVEGELVNQYRIWLLSKNRELAIVHYRGLRCDAYEEGRKNLIEAKSSIRREYIRMAAGQLLDYAYLGRVDLGNPKMAILLPRKPDFTFLGWLSELNISIIWKHRNRFFDNADGQFI